MSHTRAPTVAAGTLVLGTALTAVTLRRTPDDPRFWFAGVALAVTWLAGGRALSRPAPLRSWRPAVVGLAGGVVTYGAFVAGSLIARHIAVLHRAVDDMLARADRGPLVAVAALALVTGTGEEWFFRAGLTSVLPGRAAAAYSVAVYAAVTAAGGNLALVAAAVALGAATSVVYRLGGHLVAPVVCHATWTVGMLVAFPR